MIPNSQNLHATGNVWLSVRGIKPIDLGTKSVKTDKTNITGSGQLR